MTLSPALVRYRPGRLSKRDLAEMEKRLRQALGIVMRSDIKRQARTPTYRLRHLSENDLLLPLIYHQNKAIEKISSPQNEQRFSSVHEEAPNDQLNVLDPDRQMTQARPHAALLDSHDLSFRERVPIQTDLLGQAAWSQ